MNTIELAPAILDHLNQEPEERKYWLCGYGVLEGHSTGKTCCFDSERAAWKARERFAKQARCYRVYDAPVSRTREEIIAKARDSGCHMVGVIDEQGQLVEEWSV